MKTVDMMQGRWQGHGQNSMLFNPSHEKYVVHMNTRQLYAEASIVTRIMSGLFGVASFFLGTVTWAGVLGTLG